MKILFDQGTPAPLRRQLTGHQIDTAYEQGWSTLSNGNLLRAAELAGYQLLITTDQNLRYQQKLAVGIEIEDASRHIDLSKLEVTALPLVAFAFHSEKSSQLVPA